ncbi:MAG: DUF3108 domain-containing protein [bacterium]
MSAPGTMRRSRLTAAILAILLLAAPSYTSGAPGTPSPQASFRGGESLKYQLQWLGIPLATVRLSAEGPIRWNGKRVFRYRARLKSIGLLKRLYRVDDHAESHADARGLFSYRIDIRQKEGRYRARKWNIFEKWRTVYGRKKRPPRYYEIFGELNDILSAIYKARSLDLQPGREEDIYVFQEKYLYRVFLRVTGIERIDTLWGPVRALVVQPRIAGKSRLNDLATTWIWVTADEFHVPVRLESRTYVGPFVSHLMETRGIPSGLLAKTPSRTMKTWKPKTKRVKVEARGRASHIKKLLGRSKRLPKKSLPKKK